MIRRRNALFALGAVTLAPSALVMPAMAQRENEEFLAVLAEILQGRTALSGRVSIEAANIVREDEPLVVAVSLQPLEAARDELVTLDLLMSRGPWARAYSATLRSIQGRLRLATKLRIPEGCTLHAITVVDGENVFGATHDVKVSAGAYTP